MKQAALNVDHMLYGGDYNPEQWPEEIWPKDMELFHEAGINVVCLNVFSWAKIQPKEDEYDFSQLDKIVQLANDNDLSIIMATSTGALPAWLVLRHPDVTRVDLEGHRMLHGRRHNACINSPTFRKYATALAGKLAQRYGNNPKLVAWHVSNEYSGFCYCLENCAPAFRKWLQNKYGTIEAVNQAWNANFWGHTYHSWDEIFPPSLLNDLMDRGPAMGLKAALPGPALDYRRFYGKQVLESFREEKAAIREFDPVNPVTTNLMGTMYDLDYFDWSNDLDINSWDSYPSFDTTSLQVRFRHDLMRAVGNGKPFMLMEQTPSRANWQPYNSLKRPGQLRQQSWQAIASGADTIQYFQLRQSPGGSEKFHSAVIEADGGNKRRQFREVAALGAELRRVGSQIIGTQVAPARVGLAFDWPSWWGINYSAGPSVSLNYVAEVERWYTEVARRGIPVDIVSRNSDFTKYDVVFAPCFYMLPDAVATALREFVQGGGRLVLTPMSALAGESDLLFQGEQPVPFRDLAGIWIDETDALPPGHQVPLTFTDHNGSQTPDSPAGEILCDVIHADPGTQVLATYNGDYYAGTPALTFRPITAASASASGKTYPGGIYYMATFPNPAAIQLAVDAVLAGTGISGITLPDGVEISQRVRPDGSALTFLINSTNSPTTAVVPGLTGTDILTGAPVSDSIELEPYGVVVVTG